MAPPGVTTAGWQNKTSLAHLSLKNNNLTSIHGQKCFSGSCGIQVGDAKSWSKNEESHFENTCLHQGGGFADPGPSSTPENSTISLRTQLQSCLASVLPPCPSMCQAIDLQILVLAVDIECAMKRLLLLSTAVQELMENTDLNGYPWKGKEAKINLNT